MAKIPYMAMAASVSLFLLLQLLFSFLERILRFRQWTGSQAVNAFVPMHNQLLATLLATESIIGF